MMKTHPMKPKPPLLPPRVSHNIPLSPTGAGVRRTRVATLSAPVRAGTRRDGKGGEIDYIHVGGGGGGRRRYGSGSGLKERGLRVLSMVLRRGCSIESADAPGGTNTGDGAFAVRGRVRGRLPHHGGSERTRRGAALASVGAACVVGLLLLALVDVAAVDVDTKAELFACIGRSPTPSRARRARHLRRVSVRLCKDLLASGEECGGKGGHPICMSPRGQGGESQEASHAADGIQGSGGQQWVLAGRENL
ncbi:hypothetical protein C8J57DRAFT_1481298 [Mycena rebaudengoi]|nr:hypothetical protein C8J57DRAFT_1481298 [Mycena rebaudengoi]